MTKYQHLTKVYCNVKQFTVTQKAHAIVFSEYHFMNLSYVVNLPLSVIRKTVYVFDQCNEGTKQDNSNPYYPIKTAS